jgi:AcrR family transcriptional regulator
MRDGGTTKTRIEAAALRLFAEKGVDATSVRDITSAIGVAEATLYRHFRSKEDLTRGLFLGNYAALAEQILAIGLSARPFAERIRDLVGMFTSLFDRDQPLFSFILLDQHRHLKTVPGHPETNPVEALAQVFRHAMEEGDVRRENPDILAALAMGLVLQPAVFRLYGRLDGALSDHQAMISDAILAILAPVPSGPDEPLPRTPGFDREG